MGFPYGADEDAAYMVSSLELHKFSGVKKLAKLAKKIDKKFNGNFKLKEIQSKKNINLKNDSLLMKGPGLIDYLHQKVKIKKNIEIIFDNCIDPIFIIPLAIKLSKQNIYMHSYWIDNNTTIALNVSANVAIIGQSKNNLKIKKNQLFLKMSKNKIHPTIKLKKIKYKIDHKIEQKRLEESLNPDKKDWEFISSYANRTFVPESKESRNRGAGGGDDND